MLGRGWLLLAVPAFAGAAFALARLIPALVRAVRAARLATVPLAPEATVRLDATGALELALEGRRFTRDFAGVSVALSRAEDGREVLLHRLLLRTQVSGIDLVRLSLYAFDLPAPGEYRLRASNLGDVGPDSAFVFVRPLGAKLAIYVPALVLAGAALIGSIVLSALVLMA